MGAVTTARGHYIAPSAAEQQVHEDFAASPDDRPGPRPLDRLPPVDPVTDHDFTHPIRDLARLGDELNRADAEVIRAGTVGTRREQEDAKWKATEAMGRRIAFEKFVASVWLTGLQLAIRHFPDWLAELLAEALQLVIRRHPDLLSEVPDVKEMARTIAALERQKGGRS